jgi:colicin import membrane protein
VARSLPWIYSLGLHALLVVLLSVSFELHREPMVAQSTAVAVQATVVDESRVQQEIARLDALDQRHAREQRQAADAAAKSRAAREREEQRLAEVERQRKAAEADAARKRDEAAQQQASDEAKRQADAEAARKHQEEVQAQMEAEKARLAKLEEQRKAEEARLAAVAKERAEAEARAKREADARKQREVESELRDALAKEDSRRAAEQSGKLAQYVEIIRQKVERNWARPTSASSDLACDVQVTQIPGGEVTQVQIGVCNGDAAVKRSIEAAVYKSSPLPPPPDPSLFERELLFKFHPE